MRSIVLLCLLLIPPRLLAENCTWNSENPTTLQGMCDIEGMLSLSKRFGPTHTVKITNRGRDDGKYTVYESDGCSDKSRYPFCKGKRGGWSMTATPVDLGDGRIGLLTASHFSRRPTPETVLKDVAMFLPGHYELRGKITALKTVPVYQGNPLNMSANMLVDIRNGKRNIPLQIAAILRPIDLGDNIPTWGTPSPKGMGDFFGGESGTSLIVFGSIVATFTGFIESPSWKYSMMTVVPAPKIRELVERARKAGPEVPFVILD
jgi:hypothetical protein